jgi:hypothetical protein
MACTAFVLRLYFKYICVLYDLDYQEILTFAKLVCFEEDKLRGHLQIEFTHTILLVELNYAAMY